MTKTYTIYFAVTSSDGECVSITTYHRKTKIGANNIVKTLAQNMRIKNHLKKDTKGLMNFKAPDSTGEYTKSSWISVKNVKSKSTKKAKK